MKKLLVLINPIAGHGLASGISKIIENSPLKNMYETEVVTTDYAGHAIELSRAAAEKKYAGVIAVGGDGTVNEVASALVHTSTALGIIPAGSGNGLARHLNYSLKFEKCIAQIAEASIQKIDTLSINNCFAVNVSGLGFDGYVAWRFNNEGKRGLSNYTKIAIMEYFKYPIIHFKLNMDGNEISTSAHMLVIANASQFGNAAIIAPSADLHDGLLDLVIVEKPPFLKIPALFYRLFSGTLKESSYLSAYRCSSFSAVADRPVHLHIDGESHEPVNAIDVRVIPASLPVFLPLKK